MKRLALLATSLIVCALSEFPIAAPPPHDVTIVVSQSDLANCGALVALPTNCAEARRDRRWFFYDDVKDVIDSTLGFFPICQYGPCPYYDGSGETPPLGVGSVQISTVLNRRPNIATYQFSGTRLVDITTLRFQTYNPNAGNKSDPTRSGYLHFNVDFGPGVCVYPACGSAGGYQRRLVFVPRDNAPVVITHWQEWDAIDNVMPGSKSALWNYSGPVWPFPCIAPGTAPKSWSMILMCYPQSRIQPNDPFLGIRVGEPYLDGYTENIDAFKFGTSAGTITFDFDPVACSGGGGHGDGGMNGKNGGEAHFHFHKGGCGAPSRDDDEEDNVHHSDAGGGTDFKSSSITSSSSATDGVKRTLTMVGIGTNNGLPVGFTMIAADDGGTTPGVFTLTLSDGYNVTGIVTSGGITIP